MGKDSNAGVDSVLQACPDCPICGNTATWETALTANVGGTEVVYGSCSECSCTAEYHDWLARPVPEVTFNEHGLMPCPKCGSADGPHLYWWSRGQAWLGICNDCKHECDARENGEWKVRQIWNGEAEAARDAAV